MDRTATDTILGFNYQFNKSILEILRADSETTIVLEGYIEDIDILKKDETIAIQCKYYASSNKLNISVMTKPILDMLISFIENNTINYRLYIHYKGVITENKISFNIEMLDSILQTKNIKFIKKYFPLIYNLDNDIKKIFNKKELSKDDVEKIYNYFGNKQKKGISIFKFDKRDFIDKVELIEAPSYFKLQEEIISEIITIGHSDDEARNLFYPNLFQKVAIISSMDNIKDRKINCGLFKRDVFAIKNLLTSNWLFKLYELKNYKNLIKKNLKIRLQGNPNFRVIIIDGKIYSIKEIAAFINDYIKKYNNKPKLNTCPLFIIDDNSEDNFLNIQRILFDCYNILLENGDVARKLDIKKLFLSNNIDLRICYKCDDIDQYLLLHKPDDLFAIGSISISEYEINGIVCCKIEKLDIKDVREVFYLGG